jgi:hypothetical protein
MLPMPMHMLEASFRLSSAILLDFFGPEWTDYYLTHKGLIQETTYFGAGDQFMLRMITLAEMLLNLQDVAGVGAPRSLIGRGNIEAGFSELEAAKFLCWSGAKFKFNVPTAKSRSDFDLHVIFKNGIAGCAETEVKSEAGQLTETTVFRSLHHARKQLPHDFPAAILMKLPESWLSKENCKIIDQQIRRFLGGTETVVAVDLFATGFRLEGTVAEPIVGGVEVLNNQHRFLDRSLDWSLVGPSERGSTTHMKSPPWWTSIPALVAPSVDPSSFRP